MTPANENVRNSNSSKSGKLPVKSNKSKFNSKKSKSRSNGSAKSAPANNKNTQQKSNAAQNVDLLKEITELGGSKDDLELIKDIDSGDEEATEFQSGGDADAGLFLELKKMVSDLGFKSSAGSDKPIEVADNENGNTKLSKKAEKIVKVDEAEIGKESQNKEKSKEGNNKKELQNEVKDIVSSLGLSTAVEQSEDETDGVKESDQESEDEFVIHPPSNFSDSRKMIISPNPLWYEVNLQDMSKAKGVSGLTLDGDEVNNMMARAQELLASENAKYEKAQNLSAADSQFLKTILSGGTVSDKISALTLLIQSSPLHNIKPLESLINLTLKKNRRENLMALNALKDLFSGGGLTSSSATTGGLLPSNRKLKYFVDLVGESQVIKRGNEYTLPDDRLIVFAFEDKLKKIYFNLLTTLETLSHDTLHHVRHATVSIIFELLVTKPEQEQNLLRLLVNKLGDQDRKIASKASFSLDQLVTKHHPAMKLIVIKAIEEFMMRPNVGEKAQYYAITTLNQILLTRKETDIAIYLIDLYFTFFHRLVSKSSDSTTNSSKSDNSKSSPRQAQSTVLSASSLAPIDNKIMSAILTGVNRAYPFIEIKDDAISKISEKDKIKIDQMMDKHMDTLFKMTHIGNFGTSIQALHLIHQVVRTRESFTTRFYRVLYASLLDSRLSQSSKHHSLYLNLLFKSIKSDINFSRIQAFVKRIIQVASSEQNIGFAVGLLLVVSEIAKSQPGLWSMVNQPEEDDDVEVFNDVDDGMEKIVVEVEDESVNEEPKEQINEVDLKNENGLKGNENVYPYDGFGRTPEYSNASKTCLWELLPLLQHFHPTIQHYARVLLSSLSITLPNGNTDPLELYTLARFLDKFVYKNPKKVPKKGAAGGVAEVLRKKKSQGLVFGENADGIRTKKGGKNVMLNSEEFLRMNENEVAADDVFFHKYFTQKSHTQFKPSSKLESESVIEDIPSDAESEGSLDEDTIDAAIRASVGFPLPNGDESDDGEDGEMDEDEFKRLMELDEDDDESENENLDIEAEEVTGANFDDDDDMDIPFMEDEDDLSELELDNEEDEDEEEFDSEDDEPRSRSKSKSKSKSKQKSLGFSLSKSPFASAEEFSRMIESSEGLDLGDFAQDEDGEEGAGVTMSDLFANGKGKKAGKTNGKGGSSQLGKRKRGGKGSRGRGSGKRRR